MADQNAKSDLIWMKLGIWRFLGSLILNIILQFWNSEWWIQYGNIKV